MNSDVHGGRTGLNYMALPIFPVSFRFGFSFHSASASSRIGGETAPKQATVKA